MLLGFLVCLLWLVVGLLVAYLILWIIKFACAATLQVTWPAQIDGIIRIILLILFIIGLITCLAGHLAGSRLVLP